MLRQDRNLYQLMGTEPAPTTGKLHRPPYRQLPLVTASVLRTNGRDDFCRRPYRKLSALPAPPPSPAMSPRRPLLHAPQRPVAVTSRASKASTPPCHQRCAPCNRRRHHADLPLPSHALRTSSPARRQFPLPTSTSGCWRCSRATGARLPSAAADLARGPTAVPTTAAAPPRLQPAGRFSRRFHGVSHGCGESPPPPPPQSPPPSLAPIIHRASGCLHHLLPCALAPRTPPGAPDTAPLAGLRFVLREPAAAAREPALHRRLGGSEAEEGAKMGGGGG